MGIILLQITGYGWTAIAFMVLSVLLAVKIIKRRNSKAKAGCLSVGYIALIVFILLTFTAVLTGALSSYVINVFTLTRYESRVVSTSSHHKRSNGKYTKTIMYLPTVTFVTKDGTTVTVETNTSTSEQPAIGEVITVGYQRGMEKAVEISAGSYLIMAGTAVMLLIIGYFAIGGVLYAMGTRMTSFYNFGLKLLLYLILPLAMLFMSGALGYVVIQYFLGNKPDMPEWAVAVCCFFCLILIGGIIGYFRMLIDKKGQLIT
jgi:hypothetical protein